MPRKPTPPPPELDAVREVAGRLADAEAEVERLRAERDQALLVAKEAGATGEQLGAAANIDRRNVYPALEAARRAKNAPTPKDQP
ncbi:hypothetical protein [Amycolatopsis sp. YIM 10]|uniref:hypothetical protein n=1 Tax=Amycolatopsis sp. YIM 10 TaxID=2653857 RepID=UPI00128FD885|nr:hypothetical protein [Amycolatopsis sp. YIM 10]QFU87862.1 hypothetical protein YIM_13380 [Amycolatopsis sp. YIM 10]QFU94825.1 hypothetical protein YIM_48500 [Amycolatopsis sp. YIM 10]